MARRRSRSRFQQIGLALIVGLIALAFVLVFGQPSAGPGPNAVAEINGETVTRDAYDFFYSQIERGQRALLPPGADERAFAQQLELVTRETLLRRYVLSQEARGLGLRVSDEEIRSEICDRPFFQTDGRCDPARLQAFLDGNRFASERSYTDELRRDLLIRKLNRLLSTPIRVSEAAARERLRQSQLELRLRYAVARPERFEDRVEVAPAEAAAYAQAEPERVAAAYERRRSEFNRPEEVRARHILFMGEDALERAKRARARLDAGEDFVVLATALSQDEATGPQGGDLGFFPRGRMLGPFEEAAFAATPRTLVGPIQTERGYHLIRVEERRAGLERPLETVAGELAVDLLREDGGRIQARAAAERMAALLSSGEGFAAAAGTAGLELDETPFFGAREPLIPGIGRIPGLLETALRLTAEAPDAPRVFGTADVFYLISLAERREPDAERLAADLETTREQMEAEARVRVLEQWYQRRRRELDEAGRISFNASN